MMSTPDLLTGWSLRIPIDMIIMMERCDTARNAATKPFVSKALHARVSSSQTFGAGGWELFIFFAVGGSCALVAVRY